MEKQNYYYAKENERIGPLTIEELKNISLTNDTLIWYEGINNWTKLENIPELCAILNIQKLPPPLPEIEIKNNKTEESDKLQIITVGKKNKVSRKILRIFFIWLFIHFFALVTSLSEIKFFNKNSIRTTEYFWPFVKIFEKNPYYHNSYYLNHSYYGMNANEKWKYNGLFYKYDFSEFLVYVIGGLLIIIIFKLSNKKEK